LLILPGPAGGFIGASAQSDPDAGADAGPAANPGRPTVSTPADPHSGGISPVRKAGAGRATFAGIRRRTASTRSFKFCAAEALQFIVQTGAAGRFPIWATIFPATQAGFSLGNAGVWLDAGQGHRPTISATIPLAVYGERPDLDIGSSRNSAIILLSTGLGKFHIVRTICSNEQIDQAVHSGTVRAELSVYRIR